ncbi:LytTR family DNA-binding domain-containing protein [Puniceibacterium sediminis]|uniref:LytTR family DNA-binding domain-containing protein n=1 Tax=Puniceibacterium sediminis TaxID=1608407 RepID=UPI0015963BBD|nr:LytTR family DNA-binding domain-containing protein [Puniceibacterium sediminis]
MLLWPIALVIYLASAFFVLMLYGLIQPRFPTMVWPLPLSSAIAVVPAATVCEHLGLYLAGSSVEPDILARLIVFVPTVQVFEAVFYRFVLPTMRPEVASVVTQHVSDGNETKADTKRELPISSARHLLIGDQKVPVAGVRHIEAREHHVRVTLDGSIITRRARLSDIVAQTQPEDGCQPHRSWWVARSETIGIEREGNRHVLKMRDDIRIPVARTRLLDVQRWVERHVPDPTDQESAEAKG